MITETIFVEPTEVMAFYKAFCRISALNYVTIDSVHVEENAKLEINYLEIKVTAISAISFYALGMFTQIYLNQK